MKTQLIPLRKLTAAALLAFLLAGCSLKSPSSLSTLQIRLPEQKSHRMHQNAPVVRTSQTPGALGDFNCFIVNVTGAGVPFDPNISCSTAGDGFGVSSGFVAAGTPSVDLQVPSGPARLVQLIGIDSASSCDQLNATLFKSGNLAFSGLSGLYLLASATVDITNDTDVNLVESFNSLNPATVLSSCIPTSSVPVLTAAIPGDSNVALSWNAASGATGYIVSRDGVVITNSPITTTSYSDSTAVNGQTYTYTVAAQSAAGTSSASNAMTATMPVQLLSGVSPIAVAVDSTYLYWADATTVNRAPISGGSSTQLATSAYSIFSLVVNLSNLYWNSQVYAYAVPISGGTVMSYTPVGYSTNIVVDSTNLYWAFSPNGVESIPIGGGSATQIAADSVGGAAPYAIAMDSANIYWANWNGVINRVVKSGGTVVNLYTPSGAASIPSIAVDSTYLYFADSSGISKVPIGGGAVTPVLTGVAPNMLLVDSNNIYWATSTLIGAVPLAGGAPRFLSSLSGHYTQNGSVTSNFLAQDSTHLYVVTTAGVFSILK